MRLLEIIFGCWHKRLSFPRSQRPGKRNEAARLTGTYVVCLDCGKEFAYDWQEMRVVDVRSRRQVRRYVAQERKAG